MVDPPSLSDSSINVMELYFLSPGGGGGGRGEMGSGVEGP